ncbi:tetracycline resistance efflux system leader peptide [Variovorax sp. YR752]
MEDFVLDRVQLKHGAV